MTKSLFVARHGGNFDNGMATNEKRRSERVAWKALEPSNIQVKALKSRGTRAQCYKTSLEGESTQSKLSKELKTWGADKQTFLLLTQQPRV